MKKVHIYNGILLSHEKKEEIMSVLRAFTPSPTPLALRYVTAIKSHNYNFFFCGENIQDLLSVTFKYTYNTVPCIRFSRTYSISN